QIPRLDGLGGIVVLVHDHNLGARRYIQAGFNLAAITDGNADTGVRADQALLTNGNDDVATAGQGAHGGTATAQIRAFADDDAGGDTAFDHGGAQGACIEIDEAFMHDRGAFAQVGAQTNAGRIGDPYALGH